MDNNNLIMQQTTNLYQKYHSTKKEKGRGSLDGTQGVLDIHLNKVLTLKWFRSVWFSYKMYVKISSEEMFSMSIHKIYTYLR